ncbi:MAG: tRNA (pseudouridine(54)-N(1))-methyltransferase TrmY [Candidatus Thalassarchaeaceae archaeon]|nr:tRNA (pseudouridine(54)-N(1))-methyltransferase TrmY [Candidatus Thalassarchaeaceae archaeon]
MDWGDHLQRRFAILGHRAPSTGTLNLNDIPGSGGRADVLARAVNSSLFVSHGIRRDSHVTLHLMGGPGPHRRVWFEGGTLRGVRPDERSIAGHIRAVMKTPVPPIGQFVEVSDGIFQSGGGIGQTIAEWKKDGLECFVLDAKGLVEYSIPGGKSVGFVLSDDSAFTEEDLVELEGLSRISLGDVWLQGHACIAILHHFLDQG